MPDTITPPLSAILLSLSERLTALELAIEARSAPAAQMQEAIYDILRIRGMTAQTGEVVAGQRDQIRALAEAMTMFHGRLVEHDLRSIDERSDVRALLVQLRWLESKQAEPDLIVAAEDARALLGVAAADARAVLHEEEADARAEIAADAEDARAALEEAEA
jgi:hypothetical protein